MQSNHWIPRISSRPYWKNYALHSVFLCLNLVIERNLMVLSSIPHYIYGKTKYKSRTIISILLSVFVLSYLSRKLFYKDRLLHYQYLTQKKCIHSKSKTFKLFVYQTPKLESWTMTFLNHTRHQNCTVIIGAINSNHQWDACKDNVVGRPTNDCPWNRDENWP